MRRILYKMGVCKEQGSGVGYSISLKVARVYPIDDEVIIWSMQGVPLRNTRG